MLNLLLGYARLKGLESDEMLDTPLTGVLDQNAFWLDSSKVNWWGRVGVMGCWDISATEMKYNKYQ